MPMHNDNNDEWEFGGPVDNGYRKIEDTREPRLPSPFSPDARLMGNANLAFDGPMQTLLSVRTLENRPAVLTVCLASTRLAIPPSSFTRLNEIVAALDIGVGGQVFRTELDFIPGQQFSVLTNSLDIHAQWRHIDSSAGLPDPTDTVPVGASVGYGGANIATPPQRTLVYGFASNDPSFDGALFTVPNFATSFMPMFHSTNGMGIGSLSSFIRYQIRAMNGGTIGGPYTLVGDDPNPNFIPLPNMAAQIQAWGLSSLGTAAALGVLPISMVFRLSL